MRNICARLRRLYFFPQCAIYAEGLCMIVLLFPMRNMCARLYFVPSAQYMHKICAKLYFSPQCAIYAQDLHKICPRLGFCPNALGPLTIYAQNIIVQQVITFCIFLFKSTGQTTFNKKKTFKLDLIFSNY